MPFPLHGPGTALGSSLPRTSWKWPWPLTCFALSNAGSPQSPHIPTGNCVEVQEWDPPVSQKASITFDWTRTNSEDLLFIMLSSCHQLLFLPPAHQTVCSSLSHSFPDFLLVWYTLSLPTCTPDFLPNSYSPADPPACLPSSYLFTFCLPFYPCISILLML